MVDCKHNKLKALEPEFTAWSVIVGDEAIQIGNVCECVVWKKYECMDCGKIITILNAVVEDVKN